MSSLTGVPGSNGRITTTVGAPVSFFRSMGFDAAGALSIIAPAADGKFNGSVMMDAATGSVMASLVNAISSYSAGLPLDANGGLCTEAAAPTSFTHGVGITAAGRVAVV